MKNLYLILIVLIANGASAGEANVLLGKELKHSGYGAPTAQLTSLGDNTAVMTGLRGGWIINDSLVLGLSASGLVNSISDRALTGSSSGESTLYTNFGYGGLLLEYYFFPHNIVHLSIGTMVGAGGLLFAERMNGDQDDFEGDVLFVAEPEIGVYLNVTSFFRLGATLSYRYVTDVDTAHLSASDLSGFSGGLSLSFGGF